MVFTFDLKKSHYDKRGKIRPNSNWTRPNSKLCCCNKVRNHVRDSLISLYYCVSCCTVRQKPPCLKGRSSSVRMQNPKAVVGLLFGYAKSISISNNAHNQSPHRPLLNLLLLLPFPPSSSSSSPYSSSVSNARYFFSNRGFCGYAAEQFSDDEYDCDFDNNKVCFVLLQHCFFSSNLSLRLFSVILIS